MNALSQMNNLIDLLLDFDENSNQPRDKKIELYVQTYDMMMNPDIYGRVRDIVTDLHNQLKIYNEFSFDFYIELDPSIAFGLYAAELCSYLPIVKVDKIEA